MFNSRLISNATVSVAQTVISGLVLLVLYRHLVDHLGAEQLGLWSVILASTSVARLSELGLTGSVVKFVARYRALQQDEQAAAVVQTAFISICLVMAFVAMTVYPLLEFVLGLSLPAQSMPLALSILPWAVVSLWLSSVGGVFQSGLDGCQRIDVRNILSIAGNLLFLGAALWSVPYYGLKGLAIAQVLQGFLLVAASWLALRYYLKPLPLLPINWSKSIFKEIFGYAVNFQITSFALLLFDPATKLLMSRYGGLSSAAYYEMANQLVIKLRSLIISANQSLVPAVAELHETSPEKVHELYSKSYRLLFFIALPFFATILIGLPLISKFWIGRDEPQFILFGALLVLGWGFNTLTSLAYFVNLGTGDLKWNIISHIVMAFLNVMLGFILGPIFGGLGVVISTIVALVVAGCFVILPLHLRLKIQLRNFIPSENYPLIAFILVSVALWLQVEGKYVSDISSITTHLIYTNLCLLPVYIGIWVHPYKKIFFERLKRRL